MADVKVITDTLIAGDQERLLGEVQSALDAGTDGKEILNDGLIKGMDIVGERMESGEMFIPEVLRCAKIMSAALVKLKPHLPEGGIQAVGKVVIGTVKGDLHDIGKNLVMMMMGGAGFEITNLGVDVAPEAFVDAVKENGANMVGLSALLTTTMPMMKATVDALTESGLRDRVKVIIGGAPVTQKFADEIGADGYAPDAGSATKLAKQMVA